MKGQSKSEGLGPGVYYAREAYATLLTRCIIVAVDFGVVLFGGAILQAACYEFTPQGHDPARWFLGSWVATAYVYLVFIEASSIGTLGMILTGMKIVNLNGERPSFLRMTFRLLLWGIGPFHPVIDFVWLSNDADRQTLRDKLAGTYVVRRDAIPRGIGVVRLRQYFLLGLAILFPEVRREEPSARVATDAIS